MTATRTGNYPIGFRRVGGAAWQKDDAQLIAWARDNGFDCLDVKGDVQTIKAIQDAGLGVGTADLAKTGALITADADQRAEAVKANDQIIRRCVDLGVKVFFTCMLPADHEAKRSDNFDYMIAGYEPLAKLCDELGAHIAIEGYPGRGALACSPETLDPLFDKLDGPAMGVNYDPSHLIRLGIDPLAFLDDYIDRVYHVHGKDTELMSERQYSLGTQQPAAFDPGIAFGGTYWRYTIPGHGCMRWVRSFEMLAEAGYTGKVSIELEDANFNGNEDTEKLGLILSRQYLEGC